MGKIEVKTSNLAVSATYENAEKELAINLNYNIDAESHNLISITGAVFSPVEKGAYIGGYNGSAKDGVINYNFNSIIDLTKMNDIVACVQEIETLIMNEG